MVTILYFSLFVMSFDFLSGYTGYLSFGHTIFYGIGAYFVILVANGQIPMLAPTFPFMFSLLLGACVTALIAVAIGLVAFRLSGVYFAMITLGFAQLIYVFMSSWEYLSESPDRGVAILGRTSGLKIGVPYVDSLNLEIGVIAGESADLFGIVTLSPTAASYYAIGLLVLLCYLILQRIIHSPFGRVMTAIRENEERARAIGYNTFWYKISAFAISAFFAGIAGGLFGAFRRSATPTNAFYFFVTGDALIAAIIGGFGTLAGPFFGVLLVETVSEFFSTSGAGGGLIPLLRNNLGENLLSVHIYNDLELNELLEILIIGRTSLYLGIVFVLIVIFLPGGIVGKARERLGGKVAKQIGNRLAWTEDD